MEKTYNQKIDEIIDFLNDEKNEVELQKQRYVSQQNYEFAAQKRDKIVKLNEKIEQLEQLKNES